MLIGCHTYKKIFFHVIVPYFLVHDAMGRKFEKKTAMCDIRGRHGGRVKNPTLRVTSFLSDLLFNYIFQFHKILSLI